MSSDTFLGALLAVCVSSLGQCLLKGVGLGNVTHPKVFFPLWKSQSRLTRCREGEPGHCFWVAYNARNASLTVLESGVSKSKVPGETPGHPVPSLHGCQLLVVSSHGRRGRRALGLFSLE
jgi:hypothetical protein